jgi:hypothetical protein
VVYIFYGNLVYFSRFGTLSHKNLATLIHNVRDVRKEVEAKLTWPGPVFSEDENVKIRFRTLPKYVQLGVRYMYKYVLQIASEFIILHSTPEAIHVCMYVCMYVCM